MNHEFGGTHFPLHEALEESIFNATDFYSFTFVRNPWDRALSLFHFYKAKRHTYIRLPPKQDFNEWAIDTFDTTNPDRGSILRNSWNPGSKYGTTFTEDQFDQSHYIHNDINYIGRVETFVDDMINIGNELDIIGRQDKGKIDIRKIRTVRENTTKHKSYHQVYSKEARDVVTDFFQRDIERFGY